MARIVSIAFSPPTETPRPPDHFHRVAASQATLVADRGIEGDRKGRGGDRQLNFMSAETLAALRAEGFKTGPGEMGEQIVVEGFDVNHLAAGTRIRMGVSACVEVVSPRSGCDRFEIIQGQAKRLVRGRLGVMVRVVADGPIAVGDAVAIKDWNS